MKYHGHVAIGLSHSELMKARRDMVRCSGAPRGCCTTTLFRDTYGADRDPLLKARREPIREWIRLWHGLQEVEQSRIRKTYYRIYAEMVNLDQNELARRNKTPMSGIIKTMLDIGWEPFAPEIWSNGE